MVFPLHNKPSHPASRLALGVWNPLQPVRFVYEPLVWSSESAGSPEDTSGQPHRVDRVSARERVGPEPADSIHPAECVRCLGDSVEPHQRGSGWGGLGVWLPGAAPRNFKLALKSVWPVSPVRAYRKYVLGSHRDIWSLIKPHHLFLHVSWHLVTSESAFEM